MNIQISIDGNDYQRIATKPSNKEWIGLTSQEIDTIVANADSMEWAILMASVELRDKNHE